MQGSLLNVRALLLRTCIALYAFLWVGGVVSYIALNGPPAGSEWTAPLFLALAGGLSLALARREDRRFLIIAALIGFGSEVLGVATAFPYGGYSYTPALGPHFLGVPVTMTAAGMALAAYVRSFRIPRWESALWLTSIDLVIDPLAAGPLKFWVWKNEGWYYGIPASNFGGWLLVSALIMVFAQRAPFPSGRGLAWLGFSLVAFFAAIAFGLKMWGACAAGFLLLGWHFWAAWRSRDQSPRAAQ